jgi:biotin carboxylase
MFENLKGKKLLILGGVSATIEVVDRCHELGIVVYVTDYLEDSPAKKVADKSFMVNATDVDAVCSLCKEENIDGIFVISELLLPYYAQICEKLNFPCYATAKNIEIMTHKNQFKDCCRKYGVPTIEEYCSIEEVKNYPVIVKPIDSSASRGISVCYNKDELKLGIEKALSYSHSKRYIIEKYMTGDEIALYYYIQDGNPVFVGMCDRYVFKQSSDMLQLPTAYIFPSRYTQRHIAETDVKIKNMFKQIGMTNGPIFLQGFIEDGIPHIYEPGYRINGAREHVIIENITGVSSMDMLINFALIGKMADYDIEEKIDPMLHGKIACILSRLIGKGKISAIEGLDKVKKVPTVLKTFLNNNIGNEITDTQIGNFFQIAFRTINVEDNKFDLKKTIDLIQDSVVYYDENGNSMMLDKFDTNILIKNY